MKKTFFALILLCVLAAPCVSYASVALTQNGIIEQARVLSIGATGTKLSPDSNTPAAFQTLTVLVLEGPYKGSVITFDNFFAPLAKGDIFYLSRFTDQVDGATRYSIYDYYRLNTVWILCGVFVVLTVLFGGIQGLRGLLSLCGSLAFIFFLLLPGLLDGYSPIVVCAVVASLIIILGSYITHGFRRTTTLAIVGMIITVIITGIGAFILTKSAHLSGGFAEGSNFIAGYNAGPSDLAEILFGSILIGLLGVLYDIAIGQAIIVEELFRSGMHPRAAVYRRALRVGREHIGALVNTLAIAYVGFSLPLFLSLQLQASAYGVMFIANSDQIATEIIRILVGSIGLILAVPITTGIAVRFWNEKSPAQPS